MRSLTYCMQEKWSSSNDKSTSSISPLPLCIVHCELEYKIHVDNNNEIVL